MVSLFWSISVSISVSSFGWSSIMGLGLDSSKEVSLLAKSAVIVETSSDSFESESLMSIKGWLWLFSWTGVEIFSVIWLDNSANKISLSSILVVCSGK